MAELLDSRCDLLLVGDSVGMVVHGLPTTVGVTMDMMVLHGQAVMRASKKAFVVVDMPFGSYEASVEQAFHNAARIMKETGCQAVKIEAGEYAAATVRHLVDRGIPVMAHVGLRPQATNVDGGFRAKGRTDAERKRVIAEAKAADGAGCFAMVIEGVAEDLARDITAAVSCPTVGIGASSACDGQILVTDDLLGMFDWAEIRAALRGSEGRHWQGCGWLCGGCTRSSLPGRERDLRPQKTAIIAAALSNCRGQAARLSCPTFSGAPAA
jgi:3-methyl-2-oxobutanoate hydroxymethyltransferase